MRIRSWMTVGGLAVAALLCSTATARPPQNPHAVPPPEYPDLGELTSERLAAAEVLRFDAEVELEAGRAEVWAAWTTTAGLRMWYAPQARVELAVGGAFEQLRNADAPEGTRVLSFVPGEMLSFSRGAAPGYDRPRAARTAWSVVRLADLDGGGTLVRYSGFQLNLGEDFIQSHWQSKVQTMTYTLRDLQARFEAGPLEWGKRSKGH